MFEPLKDMYDHGDEVELVCLDGFVDSSGNRSTCLDGSFYPQHMSCVPNGERLDGCGGQPVVQEFSKWGDI